MTDFVSHAPSAEDLRDLSEEDAKELRAFLDKEIWFVEKLKILEGLPIIYPFVYPELIPSESDQEEYERKHEDNAQWNLPTKEEILKWQDERTTLEEEVLAFDGGDLGRMKAKTREVTMIPLTKPSTHLVSITLDLILLIDRLLKLLRYRGELLELTGLRLQWDDLRWKVMLGTKKIKNQMIGYVSEASSLRLEDSSLDNADMNHQVGSADRDDIDNSGLSRAIRPPTLASGSSLLDPSSRSFTKDDRVLDEITANLRTLSATQMRQADNVLDRMIDIALPLKGLGGIAGPTKEDVHTISSTDETKEQTERKEDGSSENGALPDELLDLQDELEAGLRGLKSELAVCRQVEDQIAQAKAHDEACSICSEMSHLLFETLNSSLNTPPTGEVLKSLLEELKSAKMALPNPLDGTFPRPSHPSFPHLDSRNAKLSSTLETKRREAVNSLGVGEQGVRWYEKLVQARLDLEQEAKTIADQKNQVQQVMRKAVEIKNEGLSIHRNTDMTTVSSEYEAILSDVLVQSDRLDGQAKDVILKANISAQQYKSTSGSPPLALLNRRVTNSLQDDLPKRMEDDIAQIQHLQIEMKGLSRMLRLDLQVIPKLVETRIELQEIRQKQTVLKVDLERMADQQIEIAIDGERGDQDAGLNETLKSILNVDERIKSLLSTVKHLEGLTENESSQPTSMRDLQKTYDICIQVQAGLKDLGNLLEKIRRQRAMVQDIEKEAKDLLEKIQEVVKLDVSQDGSVGNVRQSLVKEVRDWSDGLANRVVFVAKSGSMEAHHDPNSSTLAINSPIRSFPEMRSPSISASIPPYTPPSTPPLVMSNPSQDHRNIKPLDEVDIQLRKRTNESSARVSAALSLLLKPPDPPVQSREDAETDSKLLQIKELTKKINQLHIEEVAFPSNSSKILSPAALRKVPTSQHVSKVALALLGIAKQTDEISISIDGHSGSSSERKVKSELDKLCGELSNAQAYLPRLEALSRFSDGAALCDKAFGEIMNILEEDTTNLRNPELQKRKTKEIHALTKAENAWKEAQQSASEVESDLRVSSELKRLKIIWNDLNAVLNGNEDNLDESQSSILSIDDDPFSDMVSERSMSSIPPPTPLSRIRLNSSLSMASGRSGLSNLSKTDIGDKKRLDANGNGGGIRVSSNPFPRLSQTTESYRNRTISESSTSMRKRLDSSVPSSQSSRAPLPSGTSLPLGSSVLSSRTITHGRNTLPRSSGDFLLNAERSDTPQSSKGRPSLSGLGGGEGSRSRKPSILFPDVRKERLKEKGKEYVADPKSTLDQAVGRIVNKLKMNVPIEPVNIDGNEDWKDQSGRYWIGAKGRAKLCFCRILRSKTVMVRVGGGWVELSKFLMDHFSETVWETPFDNTTGPQSAEVDSKTFGSKEPIIITSSSLADTSHIASSDHRQPVSPIGPTTPVKPSGIPRSSSTSASLPRSSSLTPRKSGSGSPLMPLHFIRKASKSPPVRDKERMKYGAIKSILGRDLSGSSLSRGLDDEEEGDVRDGSPVKSSTMH